MATEVFWTSDSPGNNVYCCVWNASGEVFDTADNTFKALGSATTPGIAATERTAMGGGSESVYDAAVDLGDVHDSPAIGVYRIAFYRRAGVSPAPATDLQLALLEVRIAGGELVQAGSPGTLTEDFQLHISANVTSTAGGYLQLNCWLTRRGQFYELPGDAECYFEVQQHGSGVLHFRSPSAGTITPNALGVFEIEHETPNLVDDQAYWVKATIELDGNTLVAMENIPVIGGA